ncbi:hypothetical protein NE865_16007 [Phthorimaea operculella]|nr:hypothetical protein NE865_16007 [Phthorimaea operculella]
MIQFVTVFAAAVALAVAAPNPTNIFKIDITPEEAQQYLNSPPFTDPQLSGRNAVLPLVRYDSPQFRAAEAGPTLGHYWKNGHEIENTDDYVEEVYDASQFHGQDGLGAYAYGYKAPESAKVENRARSGDVTGSYVFKAGNNELIKVRYWADSEGFHQEDNLPKVELKPIEDTEEVKQARAAHEKAWQEAANAAAQQPDPQGAYQQGPSQNYPNQGQNYQSQGQSYQQQGQSYQQQGQKYQYQASVAQPQYQAAPQAYNQPQYQAAASEPHPNIQYQGSASEPQGVSAPAPHSDIQYQGSASEPQGVSAPREGKAYAGAAAYGQQKQPTQFGGAQYNQAQASAQYGQQQQGQEEPEPTGPPRGFFYSFDYPVSIIVRKDAQGQGGPVNPGQPIDHDTVGVSANPPRYG